MNDVNTASIINPIIISLISLAFVSLLSSCSIKYITIEQPSDSLTNQNLNIDDAENYHWYAVRFRFHWPEEEDFPNFSYHSLIGHLVVLPLLNNFSEHIPVWRIHRRAARDGAGHQFSFMFYTEPSNLEKINSQIQNDSTIMWLISDSIIDHVVYPNLNNHNSSIFKTTSDSGWSEAIQSSWPYFAMGVSRTWIDLIDRIYSDNPPPSHLTNKELIEYYENLNSLVTKQWQTHGGHAYLHHLNAIFGYEPLTVTQYDFEMRF